MSHEMLDNLGSTDVDLQREGAFQAAEACLETAVPLLVNLLQSSNLGVQEAADYALRKIGGRTAIEGVLPLLRSDHPPIRNLGMDLLRALGYQHLDLLVPQLKDDDPDVRIFIADILGSTNDVLAVQPLCEALLHDPEVNVRYQAAVSLGELARPEAARSLNQALSDDEWVQFAVIEALMKIGDDSSINAFVRALDRSSELVGSMIIDALGEMGNLKAVPMLFKRLDSSPTALRNKILRAIVRIMGAKSLSLLSAEERARFATYLLVALDDEDVEIQDAAIMGLGFVGSYAATGKIIDLVGPLDADRDLERVNMVVAALARIGVNAELERALQGEESKIRIAILVLERIASPEAIELMMRFFPHYGRDMQRSLSAALARISGAEAQDFFLNVLDNSTDGTVLKQALHFLGSKLRCPECADAIVAHLHHPYNDVKDAALDAAIALGTPAIMSVFESMSASPDNLDRLMGLYGLGELDARRFCSLLQQGLYDESADVRKICVEALSKLSHDPEIVQMLLPMAHDEVAEVRLALVEVMGQVCSPDGHALLYGALRDEEDWVRIRAVEALAECQQAEDVSAIIPLLEDPNQLVVLKVMAALGRMGGQAAFQALMNMLGHEDPEVQAAAEQALDAIQSNEETH